MVRKGWTHMEVPDGWLQLLQGPRPKAEKCPHQSVRNSSAAQMPGKPQFGERWRNGVSQPQQHTAAQALQPALAALDPEDGNARAGIEAALKRVKDQAQAATQANRAPVPECSKQHASEFRSWRQQSRPWESSRVQKINFSRELWHVPELPPPRLQWTCS